MSNSNRCLISITATLIVAAFVIVPFTAAGRGDKAHDTVEADDLKTQVDELNKKTDKLTDDNANLVDQIVALRKAHDEVIDKNTKSIDHLIANLKDARQEAVQRTDAVKKFVVDRNLRVVCYKWHGITATPTEGIVLQHQFDAPVIEAVAGIVGFDQSYGGDDHHIQRLAFAAQVESIQGAVVRVRYQSWMHDNGGNRAGGNVSVLLIARLAG
jgi:ElaB/YqjD/DUF883 family membrane-anchored ribosome-binding protein